MGSTENIIVIIAAYLLGSFASAVFIGKLFFNTDVREYGSGSSGATNTFRVLGKKAGIIVLFLDVLKGWGAVTLPFFFNYVKISHYLTDTVGFTDLQIVLGIAALMGHIFPIYVGFRGGKGIATLLGVIIAMHPLAASISLGIFAVVLVATSFVSLGSIIAALSFPVITIGFYQNTVPSFTLFSLLIPILVLVTHQKNIERLLRKEENKATILKFKKSFQSDD